MEEKKEVLIVADGMRTAALLAAVGGVSVESVITKVANRIGEHKVFGPPVLKGKRLERIKKQCKFVEA